MRLSRRGFVGSAAGAMGGWLVSGASGWALPRSQAKRTGRTALLDLGTGCVLRESLEGYRAALLGQDICFSRFASGARFGSGTVIVPGVGVMDRGTIALLLDLLQAGAKVVLESGAGFLLREEFVVHQRTLLDYFGLLVDSPVDLWLQARTVPYVSYSWPRDTMVRDFSRAVPVVAPEDEIIGLVGGLPVASKRPVGRGLLIFLGSPMGSAMRCGDRESQEWLRLLQFA